VNSLDDRMITADQLRAKVCEYNVLSHQQQELLYGVLIKYQQHLTKRPGKCDVFEYEFKIEGDMPPTANSWPIPFALRTPIREQIQAMLNYIWHLSTHLHQCTVNRNLSTSGWMHEE
jgi:hypothetical protein